MENYKEILQKLISFKSISTSSEYKNQIDDCVSYLEDMLLENGFTVDIIPGYSNPIIFANIGPKDIEDAKTCLIYGHYDVQPADLDGWFNNPFELHESDGRYYGRGVLDNKGQFLVHLCAIFDLIKSNTLKYNVKILLEGNEETGSADLGRFVEEHLEALKCDFVMVSDGEISKDTPVVEVGFRGVVNCQLEILSSHTDLHSGIYGGAAVDAGKEMISLLSKMYDQNGALDINDMKVVVPEEMKKACAEIAFDEEEYKNITGTKGYFAKGNFYEVTGIEPAITVTGMEFGYTGEGYRNAVPHKAMSKINIRTSPLQKPEKIAEIFEKWVDDNVSKNVDAKLKIDDISNGAIIDIKNEFIINSSRIMEEIYGKAPILKYCGGTLPIASMIQNLMNVPQLYIPFGNEDCNMHGTNENFVIEKISKAFEFSKRLLGSQ